LTVESMPLCDMYECIFIMLDMASVVS
jgi:hypothetical protein